MTAYLKRSRDAARASNLKDITTAVGAYYSDREEYPAASSTGCVNATLMNTTNYFPKGMPQDPKDITQSPCNAATGGKGNYGYGTPSATAATGFVVSAIMENANGGNYATTTGYTGQAVNVSTVQAGVSKGTGAIYVLTN
jgi:hypothetical protein